MDLIKLLNETVWYEKFDSKGKKHLSASSFSKEPIEIWLELNNYAENPFKLSDATVGSIVHLGLESLVKKTDEYKDGNLSVEQRLVSTIDGYEDWVISGTPDLIDMKNKIIYDYKTGKNYSKTMLKKEGKNNRYAIQLAIYNWLAGGGMETKILWLMKDSKIPEGQPVIFETEVEIMSPEEIEQYMKDKLKLLDTFGDKAPAKCGDLWKRKVRGAFMETKCQFYCRYSNVCPRNKPTPLQNIASW